MESFKAFVQTTVAADLRKSLGISNALAVPKVTKIIVSSGLSTKITNPKLQEAVVSTLTRITGQKPVLTKARKSIAGFKVREGMIVGAIVTLRGNRMYDFLGKLIQVTLPRIRDFRGIEPSVIDANGNASIGFKEHLAFPEIRSDEIDFLHGLQVTIVTTAGTREKGLALFRALGFPLTS